MRRILPFIPVVVLLALGVLFATYGLHHDPTVQPNALIGKPAPAATYPPLDGGQPVRAAALLDGKPGLINVFGSWCGPCAVEAPQLMRLKEAGVNIVGVTWRDRPGDTHAFLDRTGNPFSTVLNGGEGSAVDFGITGAPETFIVDAKGMVVDKRVGVITEADVPVLVKMLKGLS
jgi:cytochrome c biogenesis protein CcmG/thiol:disulfide interchange protein DsbE